MDTRAQSLGIARYVMALVVGAIMFWIINEVTQPMRDRARNATSNATANQGTDWLSQGVDFWPIAILLISFFGLLVYSVYIREVSR